MESLLLRWHYGKDIKNGSVSARSFGSRRWRRIHRRQGDMNRLDFREMRCCAEDRFELPSRSNEPCLFMFIESVGSE